MTKKNWQKYVSELDALVRSGRGSEARRRLMSERRRKMPPDIRVQIANIARRSGLPLLSLQILRPLIASEKVMASRENQEQQAVWASYGAGLIAIGSLAEGREFLSRVDADSYPEVLLTLSIGFFKEWDYEPSVALLKKFISSPKITEYQRLVGQVNLAAAYSAIGRYRISQRLIRQGLRQAKVLNAKLLQGNLFEILAQNYFFQGDFERADKTIREAQATLQNANVVSSIFIEKWKTLLSLEDVSRSRGHRDQALLAASQLRAQAIANRHWETVRDLDFHLGIWQKNVNMLEKLYWGTPFRGYRQKIRERSREEWLALSIEKKYFEVKSLLVDQPESQIEAGEYDILDLQNWTWRGKALSKTERMKNNHRMLLALFRDLYRSERVGRIYSLVFPGEHFDAFSSVNRLSKCTQRLREWLEQQGIPLKVGVRASEFRIEMTAPLLVRLPTDVQFIEKDYTYYLHLYHSCRSSSSDFAFSGGGGETVCNESARACWGVSRRTAQRLLARLEERGWLRATGVGRGRVYSFTKQVLPSGRLRSQSRALGAIDLSNRKATLKTG